MKFVKVEFNKRKVMKTLLQAPVIIGFFLVGDWLQHTLHLPLPGSIIGLLLLWTLLLLKVIPLNWIESGSYLFLAYLPLYLLPATVGAINYGHVFMGKGFILIPIIIVSTLLTMGIASKTSQFIAKKSDKDEEQLSCKQ